MAKTCCSTTDPPRAKLSTAGLRETLLVGASVMNIQVQIDYNVDNRDATGSRSIDFDLNINGSAIFNSQVV